MKNLFTISLLLNAVLVVLFYFPKDPPTAKAAECTSINGDVDGNGAIDLADVIQILNYAFVGTVKELAPLCNEACSTELAACQAALADCQAGNPCQPLPATGQTKCYNLGGGQIGCASADYPGQDGFYQVGCPVEGRFVDNGDGTVTDTCTGLMWQQGTAPGVYKWQNALKYCDSLTLGNHSDWRLPNVRELRSIVDYGRIKPSIDPVFSASSVSYWSSTTAADLPSYAWFIDFLVGIGLGDGKSNSKYVRAVRSGP